LTKGHGRDILNAKSIIFQLDGGVSLSSVIYICVSNIDHLAILADALKTCQFISAIRERLGAALEKHHWSMSPKARRVMRVGTLP
jgi:hypothetical protein